MSKMEKIRVSSCCTREAVATKYQCTYCEGECEVVEVPDSGKIRYMITPGSIEWEMNWAGTDPDWQSKYPGKPEKEMIFEQEAALALLLINEVIHINSHHWKKEWPEDARKSTALGVNCSDIFAWGCADSEEISVDEIESLYRMWKHNAKWGAALWCMIKRREMPQSPVADAMRKDGVDLGAFQKEHNLRINFYSGCCLAQAKFKYETYIAWCHEKGCDGRPFDAGWWKGWDDFSKAHPDWEESVGKQTYARIREQFIKENGWEGEVSDG